MYLDAFTTLLFGLLLKVLLGILFIVFWLMSRRAPWFAWWSAPFFCGAFATLFFLRGFDAEFFQIGVAVASLIAGFACCWQGMRTFERREPLWWPVLAAPALWLGACLVPGFLENVSYRVLLSSSLLSPLIAMSAVELWRGRQERLASRWTVIVLFVSLALVFSARIPLLTVAPFPFGALPAQPGVVALFNLILFFHTILLAVLLVAMTKERLELEQRARAQTDPLTGALNRRAFMSRGRRLLQRHERSADPLSLLFLDLDHFKSLNDRYGHSRGDDVLMGFVALVHANIRPGDFLFRIGGEEFCCLLPETLCDQALRVAERIREQFEATASGTNGIQGRVTVSVGVAATETFGYDLDVLVRNADKAVYAAKRQGRNQVVVAQAVDPAQIGSAA